MKRRSVFLAGLLISSATWVAAQNAWPARAITMIVPFPPGGLADLVARPVAEAMSRDLGQPVVVENKGGAGGGIGMSLAAKAKPDGYTVLMALSSLTVIPEADAVLARQPMFALNDLRPIARFTADPTVLAGRADSPRKTGQQIVDNAEYAQWSGLFIPKDTPEPIAQRLRAAAKAAAQDGKVKAVILNAGSPVLYQDSPDFEKYVQADAKRMAEVVKKIGKVE